MGTEAINRRRWLGGIALTGAILMLVTGETVLKGRLSDVAFLVFWLVCFLLTMVAIAMAFLDMRMLQRRTTKEQRDLLESTLSEIADKARDKRTPREKR